MSSLSSLSQKKRILRLEEEESEEWNKIKAFVRNKKDDSNINNKRNTTYDELMISDQIERGDAFPSLRWKVLVHIWIELIGEVETESDMDDDEDDQDNNYIIKEEEGQNRKLDKRKELESIFGDCFEYLQHLMFPNKNKNINNNGDVTKQREEVVPQKTTGTKTNNKMKNLSMLERQKLFLEKKKEKLEMNAKAQRLAEEATLLFHPDLSSTLKPNINNNKRSSRATANAAVTFEVKNTHSNNKTTHSNNNNNKFPVISNNNDCIIKPKTTTRKERRTEPSFIGKNNPPASYHVIKRTNNNTTTSSKKNTNHNLSPRSPRNLKKIKKTKKSQKQSSKSSTSKETQKMENETPPPSPPQPPIDTNETTERNEMIQMKSNDIRLSRHEIVSPTNFFTRFDPKTKKGSRRIRNPNRFQVSSIYNKRDRFSGYGGAISMLVGVTEEAPYDELVIDLIFDTSCCDNKDKDKEGEGGESKRTTSASSGLNESKAYHWYKENKIRFQSPLRVRQGADYS